MKGIIFESIEGCESLKLSLLSRIEHLPEWVPFVPYQAADGRWCCPIVESVFPFLTPEEQARLATMPIEFVPPDPIGGQP